MEGGIVDEIERALDFIVVVEGKKDKAALDVLGFKKVFVLNETGISLDEQVEKIVELYEKKDKVCILTDFDKRGKKIFKLLKSRLSELGVKFHNGLRSALLDEHIGHVEELSKFMEGYEG